MFWMKSKGGPLICVERRLMPLWLGVRGNSLAIAHGVENAFADDYARACNVVDFLGLIALGDGNAMILGDMPLETTIWHAAEQLPMIIRVYYSDPDVNVINVLESGKELDFSTPLETSNIEVGSADLIVFDSADAGNDVENFRSHLTFKIPPGPYMLITKQFEPNDKTSVLIHRFVPYTK
jgi:hypothetical protein